MQQQLTGIATHMVETIRLVGVTFFVVFVCLLALGWATTFGNEHKMAILRAAMVCLVVGTGLLLIAPLVAKGILALFPSIAP